MTQSDVDIDFLNGLQLMIDSMAASHLEKADDPDIPDRFSDAPDPIKRVSHNGDEEHLPEDRRPLDSTIAGGGQIKYQRNIQNADENETEDNADKLEVASTDWESTNDLPEANHWCPDVQAWHTSDHEPAKAPSVHVNVGSKEGDDPDQSENGEVEKGAGLLAAGARAAAPAFGEAVGQAAGEKIGSKIKGGVEKGSVAEQHVDMATGIDSLPGHRGPGQRPLGKEYDQNTNLDRHEQENTEESIAEPFLNRREVREDEGDEEEDADIKKSNDGIIDSVEQTHGKAIDILKLWASVDRVLPKTDSETMLVNDINILKSFDLDETTNVEDLVTGTLVHKMLVDRASRPTEGWWDSSMLIAKSIDSIDEPAFFSAFLYYEPDTFHMGDFIDIEKAERSEYSKPQDQEDMPNSSGGSAIDGLGMSADDLDGPKDEECDD